MRPLYLYFVDQFLTFEGKMKIKKTAIFSIPIFILAMIILLDLAGFNIPLYSDLLWKVQRREFSPEMTSWLKEREKNEKKDSEERDKKIDIALNNIETKWNLVYQKLEMNKKLKILENKYRLKFELINNSFYANDYTALLITEEYLDKGRLPVYVEGDLDCNGQKDSAYLTSDNTIIELNSKKIFNMEPWRGS